MRRGGPVSPPSFRVTPRQGGHTGPPLRPCNTESECLFHEHSGGFHLFNRALAIIGPEVYATASVEHDMCSKSKGHGIQRGELHAIIGGETEDVSGVDPLLLKIASQSRIFGAAVIKESAIAVDFSIDTFLEDPRPSIFL